VFEADLHTHTVASGHAYGTITENAKAAREQGLLFIATTDHGPANGGPEPYYFINMRVVPREIHGVRILRSVEGNIMDGSGSLDLEPEILGGLDLVVAGFHLTDRLPALSGRDLVDWCTETLCATIANPFVDIIAHPGNPVFPVDAERVVRAAVMHGKALEVNNNSFTARPGSWKACGELARLYAKHGALVSIASDAHFPSLVGDVGEAAGMCRDAGIVASQVVNLSASSLARFLDARAKRLSAPVVSLKIASPKRCKTPSFSRNRGDVAAERV